MKFFLSCTVVLVLLQNIVSCKPSASSPAPADETSAPTLTIKTMVTGYEVIWGMDFLPNGDLLFNEKRGKIYRKAGEVITEITGFPAVRNIGQGGLLDLRVHPNYSNNGWVYASYFANAANQNGGTLKLVRFKILGNAITNLEQIFDSGGLNTWNGHCGSRIVFKDGLVFLSIGEGGPGSYGGTNKNLNAQDVSSNWGKVHRMTETGGVPADNPILPGNTVPTTIYTYGNRNPQGLAMEPGSGQIWEAEHGPKGGDEINLVQKGANYGWPMYSLGINYDGVKISDGHKAAGITEPKYAYIPSIGTSGIAFINNPAFKNWDKNLLVSGLALQVLHRCVIKNNQVVSSQPVEQISGRVRNVIQGPDGNIYVSLEGPGRIVQIKPS